MRLLAGTERVALAAAGGFDGVYTYDFLTNTGAKFARFCAQAHAMHLACAPSVGPGYDGHRAGEPPLRRTRQNGATYDSLWSAALAAAPTSCRSRASTNGARARRSKPAQARHGYASYDGAWGLVGAAAQTAYLCADGVLGRAQFHGVR